MPEITEKELEAQLEWQPIETAPKDGTVILIYKDRQMAKKVFPATWTGHTAYPWRAMCDEYGICYLLDDSYITHWMPLPEPPKESE